MGCSTQHDIITYDDASLKNDRIGILEFSDNSISKKNKVKVKAIDNVNTIDDSTPGYIKFLPGNHSILIEYFSPNQIGYWNTQVIGNVIIRNFIPPSPRGTIAEGTVTLNVEAGHKYRLAVDNLSVLSYTIEDLTTENIVFPKRAPLPFSLSDIPKDKAVVCFYRPWKLLSAISPYFVLESKKSVDKLPNNSLFYHVTDPGDHTYSITYGGHAPVTTKSINLMPSGVTYLKADVYEGELVIVQKDEALKDISSITPSK